MICTTGCYSDPRGFEQDVIDCKPVIGIDFTNTPTVRKPITYISHLLAVAGIDLEANARHQINNIEGVSTRSPATRGH